MVAATTTLAGTLALSLAASSTTPPSITPNISLTSSSTVSPPNLVLSRPALANLTLTSRNVSYLASLVPEPSSPSSTSVNNIVSISQQPQPPTALSAAASSVSNVSRYHFYHKSQFSRSPVSQLLQPPFQPSSHHQTSQSSPFSSLPSSSLSSSPSLSSSSSPSFSASSQLPFSVTSQSGNQLPSSSQPSSSSSSSPSSTTHFCIHRLCIRQNGQASTGVEICYNDKGDVVRHGEQYVPLGIDTCTQCTCMNGKAEMCISVLCSPPENCRKYEEVSNKCCEFLCLDRTDSSVNELRIFNKTIMASSKHGLSASSSSSSPVTPFNASPNLVFPLGLRLIASTITSFLILALLLFMIHRIRQRRLLFMIRRLQNRRMDPMRPHGSRNHHHPGHLLNEHVFHFGYFGLGPSATNSAGAGGAGGVRPSETEENFGYIEPPPPYSYWKRPDQYCINPPNEAPPTYEETISTNIPSFPAYYPAITSGNNNNINMNSVNNGTNNNNNNNGSLQQQAGQQVTSVIQDYAVISSDQSQVGIIQLHAPPPEINCNSIPYYPLAPIALSPHQQTQQHQHLHSLQHNPNPLTPGPTNGQYNGSEFVPAAAQLVRHNSMPLRNAQERQQSIQQQHRILRQSIRASQQQQQYHNRQQIPQPIYHSQRFFPNVRPGIAAAYNETLTPFSQNEMILDSPDHITVVHIGRESERNKRNNSAQKSLINSISSGSSSTTVSARQSRQNSIKKLSLTSGKNALGSAISTPQTPDLIVSNSMTSLLSPNNSLSPSPKNCTLLENHNVPLTNLQKVSSPPAPSSSSSPSSSSASSSNPTVINSASVANDVLSPILSCSSVSTVLTSPTIGGQQHSAKPSSIVRRSSQHGIEQQCQNKHPPKRDHHRMHVTTDTVQIPLKCDPRTISRL